MVRDVSSKAELEAMSPEELDAYFAAGGNVMVGAVADNTDKGPRPLRLPTIDSADPDSLTTTSVRLPISMLAKLASAAGRDREGKSGIIRQAVEEWFARHPEVA